MSSGKSDFLGSLESGDREALSAVGVHRAYSKGEYVFRAGDPGAHVYFLESGRTKIYQPADSGREVILWFCLPGEIFGLAEVARGGGRVVSAQACEASTVLAVSQEAFRGFVAAQPRAALLSMQVLSARLRGLSDVMVNLVADDVDTRIAKLILRLGARYGRREGRVIHLDIPLTHQEIADMVGTTRQTVTSTLSRMKRKGVLSIDTHRIDIESEELLAGLTHDGGA
ncbi:MAG: Crp/Fnr family transcriptional regulator [Burkholderiales bacterium]